MNEIEIVVRIASALALGTVIGLERQWRARMAGLRTNSLVCLGAALFVVLSAMTPGDASPSRVAAQVVSGVGFLGAGVIIRDGASLRGINTAATLWGSAAVGSLCGAGLYLPAALGAGAIVVANLALRPVARTVERHSRVGTDPEEPVHYDFKAICRDADEAHVRALVVQAVSTGGFALRGVHSEDIDASGKVTVTARLAATRRDDKVFETAVSRLSLEPGVSSVSWRVATRDEVDL
ncbi:membrane protein [Cellulomonas bogoriensis 69B4 = DSM 16987]|uniref:Membrane protein n=1 Tax=Cellulomonas bogoriensis 69B4 = DSM 16987 TaxID=1386082 RepID=A0A0A0BU99_9CELL|nr:membrane protein [Cellulomonas bogoriensis 69B4 = DSM 16987]